LDKKLIIMKLTKQRLKEIIEKELGEARKPKMDEKQLKTIRKQLTRVRAEIEKSMKMIGKTYASDEYNELRKVYKAFGDFESQLPISIRNSWNEGLNEDWKSPPGYSSKEARTIMDKSVREYAGILRKAEHKIIKDWMSKAKAGVLDFFDINRGITSGDITRAHKEEVDFLHSVLTRDKIIDRFRSYFGGKKGKAGRRN